MARNRNAPQAEEKPAVSPAEPKATPQVDPKSTKAKKKPPEDGIRETIESIAMAVILALIFRAFVAEAFVIPTGSMAPTLQGRHKDISCPQCGLAYQTGASFECNQDGSLTGSQIIGATCPNCRFTQLLDLYNKPNDQSFSGDRIIVSKFAYSFADPQRWDVIVFKYPGSARDNYIKRLIGLPNETVKVEGGNIYIKAAGADAFQIARKPPEKLNVLLQLVHNNDHPAPELQKAGWRKFWYDPDATSEKPTAWKEADEGRAFEIAATTEWSRLRFRHIMPKFFDWDAIEAGEKLDAEDVDRPARLILDMYAYNTGAWIYTGTSGIPPAAYDPSQPIHKEFPEQDRTLQQYPEALGQHWVDDLAVDCSAEVKGTTGELALELRRAGNRYQATIDVATGEAKLSIVDRDGAAVDFVGDDGTKEKSPTAATSVKGPGVYRLRLSNVDHQLLLWVNGAVVKFAQPTTYESPALVAPVWTEQDAGDAEPAIVSARNVAATLSHLKILRDKYYIATNRERDNNDYNDHASPIEIGAVMANPEQWMTTNLFAARRGVEFEIPANAFMPMGDNSPYSKDARVWSMPDRKSDVPPFEPAPVMHYVKRDLMVGKALLIYWPHSWNRPPLWPNFQRMSLIR